ncbi:MAG: NAD(+)/NADH kinase [Desulfomonilaceae bacterium]|nr:NAD(+)/NADH kinase [Desulfomonilaceae bacterium]
MQRIGFVLKRAEEKAVTLGEEISRFLVRSGKDVLLETSCEDLAAGWNAKTSDHICDDSDLLVVLGGDGTLLRAASLLNCKPTPILGVNLGRVGFIAETSPHEAIPELRSVMEGSAILVKRILLQVTLPDGTTTRVLNDAVIHWGGIARIIDLGIRVGRAREIDLRADGLIVSTPIGSSAYSYAAHGPLVHPDIEAVLLTPICPYAGLKRPLLVPPDVETDLILKKGEELMLTLDGRTTVPLNQGDTIRVQRAPLPFVMVKSGNRDYFDVLKEKLGLL